MLPILFSIGPFSISSFGFFLALALILSIFIIWRLIRVYDIDPEKTLDVILLTFFGGILGARLYFVLTNLILFDDISKVFLINKYPGLSFWGGLITGVIILRLVTPKMKLNFWQMADFGAVGLTIGLAVGNIGCFLGGCAYGVVSDSPFAASVVGQIGKRFPITLVESLLLLFVFIILWRQVVRFHFFGKIVSLFLIFYGVIRLLTENYRADRQYLPGVDFISIGTVFSAVLATFGVIIYYSQSKRKITTDIKAVIGIFSSARKRKEFLYNLGKTCYNYKIVFKIILSKGLSFLLSFPSRLKGKTNVKFAPKNFR